MLNQGNMPKPKTMILSQHPDKACFDYMERRITPKAIGYWRATSKNYTSILQFNKTHCAHLKIPDMRLPDPYNFVDLTWNKTERDKVIIYLNCGITVAHWCGWSDCRFCDCMNGSTCLSDGVYVWPEGFEHYLEKHNVKPDQQFIDHVLNNIAKSLLLPKR